MEGRDDLERKGKCLFKFKEQNLFYIGKGSEKAVNLTKEGAKGGLDFTNRLAKNDLRQ